MKYLEYKEKVGKLLKKNDKLWKQTHIMFIPIDFKMIKEIGLFWEIYMLRNRIIHFTKARYDKSKAECIRFQDFSSKAKMIIIDSNENICIKSTLIDINKSNYIQEIIRKCINDKGKNPFELLFPNTSAKGYSKNTPFLSAITNDIWFDYIFSGVSLIERIQNVLDKINNLFFEKILSKCDDITNILSKKTCILRENVKMEYSVQDVFDCDVNFKTSWVLKEWLKILKKR